MVKSNIKTVGTYIPRSVIASNVYKYYIKDGVKTLKQGVSLATVSEWWRQGYAPIDYHESILKLPDLRERVTADQLFIDLRNKNLKVVK